MSASDPKRTLAFKTCCAAQSMLKPSGSSHSETSILSGVDRRAAAGVVPSIGQHSGQLLSYLGPLFFEFMHPH